jgi:hypothetical protein
MEEFPELVKLGYCTQVNIKSSSEVFTNVKSDTFVQAYKLQRVVIAINAATEQKRKGGGTGK